MSSNYKVITTDLTNGADGLQLIPPGQFVQSITVVGITDNTTTASIGLGGTDSAKQIPLALGVRVDACPAERDGVFLTAAAQPGKSIVLSFSFGVQVSQGVG